MINVGDDCDVTYRWHY